MKKFIDQIGNTLILNKIPNRIVSLVPSITELLFDLDLKDKIVGITKYCVEPKGLVEKITKIGGTKKVDLDLVLSLKPDLIIASREENVKEQVEYLQQFVPVWTADVITFEDAIAMIESLGLICDRPILARDLIQAIQTKKQEFLRDRTQSIHFGKKSLYFIWRKPYMVVGANTFINSMLEICSLRNLASNFAISSRYPVVQKEDLINIDPELVLLSTEPYPFGERHLVEFQELFTNADIMIVRGDYFSWYGSRLNKAFDYFKEIFNI
ncbi:MAG: ABC transporter substrate-binding protein [Candidatus Kapaibacteriota bacterium]